MPSDSETGGKIRSGEINIEMAVADLASSFGLRAGEYKIEDVWLADSDGVIEVDLRELHTDN